MDALRRRRRRRRVLTIQMWLLENSKLLAAYYYKFLYKVPCYNSAFTGYVWMHQLMDAENGIRCINAFRMEKDVLLRLCGDLESKYGLLASRNMTTLEKAGIFLYTMALGLSNRDICERFQRSGETVSRVVHEVLEAIVGRSRGFHGLARDIIRPSDPSFSTIPDKISKDNRYKYFEGAIGCIDGTHINACIPKGEQLPYRGRKGMCSFNVMAVCDFDMYFTFISAGWEGSAHDARVFDHALRTTAYKFPHPPPAKYYLVDKGYPDKKGYLVPYSKTKYHPSQFENVRPSNVREAFNRSHSSLRSCIERCFGVLKKRWKILAGMPCFDIQTQVDIIVACFALHNFILKHSEDDKYLRWMQERPQSYFARAGTMSQDEGEDENPQGMKNVRDLIAARIWNDMHLN